MDETSDLIKLRREKLDQLRAKGINPFTNRFKVRDDIGSLIGEFSEKTKEELEEVNRECLVAGRMMTRRKHGKTTFCHIKDRAGQIQIYVKKDDIGAEAYEIFTIFDIGDFIGVEDIDSMENDE